MVRRKKGKAARKKAKVSVRRAHAPSARKAIQAGILAHSLANARLRQTLIDVAGENALDVIKCFQKNMSDEELARKTKLKVSDVRVVLNRLHNYGLAKYYRNRDKDSGWYSYVWCFEQNALANFAGGNGGGPHKQEEVQGERYSCSSCGPESVIGFETASVQLFRCQYCGSSLEFVEK